MDQQNQNNIPKAPNLSVLRIPDFINMLASSDYASILRMISHVNSKGGFVKIGNFYIVTAPAIYEQVIRADIDNPGQRVMAKTMIDKVAQNSPGESSTEDTANIIGSSDKKWRRLRSAIGDSFSPAEVGKHSGKLKINATKAIDLIRSFIKENKSFNLRDIMIYYTMNSLMDAILGINFDSYAKDQNKNPIEFAREISDALSHISAWRLKSIVPIIGKRVNAKVNDAKILIDKLTSDILGNGEESSSKFIKNITAALRRSTVSEREAKELISMIIFAGHDTTANSLTFWIHDSIRKNEFTQLLNEIKSKDTITDKDGGEISISDILSATDIGKQLDWQLAERAQAAIMFRDAAKGDFQMNGETVIPQGSNVLLIQLGVGENMINKIKELESKKESGQILSSDEETQLEQYARMMQDFAFSFGARGCLGKYFAKDEMLIFLNELSKSNLTLIPEDTSILGAEGEGGAFAPDRPVMVTAEVLNIVEG